MKSKHTGIRRIVNAFGYSVAGLRSVFLREVAFRQDLLLCVVACVMLILLPLDVWKKVLMFFSLWFIPIAELINTAIENVVDRIGDEYHELSKSAKDIGSALVLIAIVLVFAFWAVMIFFV